MSGNLPILFKTPFYIVKTTTTILRSPALISLCIVPLLIGLLASCAGFIAAFTYREPLIGLLGLEQGSWYFALLGWLAFLFGCIISALAGFVTASIAGGYFVELVVERLLFLKQLRPQSENSSLLQVLFSTLRALCNELILMTGIFCCSALAFILGFIPFLAFLPLGIGLLLAGFTLFNLPLAIIEVPLTRRFAIVRRQLLPCIGLGGCFSVMLLVPFASVLLLPAFYGAAVEILTHNPEFLRLIQEKANEKFETSRPLISNHSRP